MGCCERIFLLRLTAELEKVAKQPLIALKSCRLNTRFRQPLCGSATHTSAAAGHDGFAPGASCNAASKRIA
jgi:hypothetical protein